MSGLAGFLDRQKALSHAERLRRAAQMAGALDHRAPDQERHWIDAEQGLVIVHKERSIPGQLSAAEQPRLSSDGRFVLSMDGSLQNTHDMCIELSALGAPVAHATDPEIVLEAFVHWGLKETLEKISGCFALVLWDRRKNELHLVRDPHGTKPLYYGWSDGHLLFGSELHALEAFPEFRSALCPHALALYTERGFVPAPHTLWQSVRKLASGTFVTFEHPHGIGAWPEPHLYWDFEELVRTSRSTPFKGSIRDAVDKCDRLIHHSVRRQMSDMPAGVLLDQDPNTHLVAAVLQRESPDPITTVSVNVERINGEVEQANDHTKEVALRIGAHHQSLVLKCQDIWTSVPLMAQICDEPNGDIAVVQKLLAIRQTGITTNHLMTGLGGQDLFGIRDPYGLSGLIGPITDYLPVPFGRTMGRILNELSSKIRSSGLPQTQNGLLQQLSSTRAARLAVALQSEHPDQIYRQMTGDWISSSQVMVQKAEHENTPEWAGPFLQEMSFSEQMMFQHTAMALPDCEFSVLDRSTSANGLKTSHPLLDHSLTAFCWTLPTSLKFGRPPGHHLLMRLLGRYLPNPTANGGSRCSALPVAAWLRGPLRDWAEHLLDARSVEDLGFFDGTVLTRRWKELLAGSDDDHSAICNSLILLDWFHVRRARGLVT